MVQDTQSLTVLPGRNLTGAEKVAVLLLALDRSRATKLLQRFEPEELRLISRSANDLRPVTAPYLETLIEEFADKFSNGVNFVGSAKEVESLLAEAVGEDEMADILSEDEKEDEGGPIWERISKVKTEALRAYLLKEHPQTAAVVLLKIESVAAAKVIASFPANTRRSLLSRMLGIKTVSEEAVEAIGAALRQDFPASAATELSHAGIADILNKLDKGESEELLRGLAEVRPDETKALKSMLFSFEDLVKLESRVRTLLFDQMPVERLIVALQGTDGEFQAIVLSSLASRSRRMVEAELQGGAQAPPREVAEARRAIVDVVLKMAAKGEVQLQPGDEANG
jgi:flagellar motor switch protein FliG